MSARIDGVESTVLDVPFEPPFDRHLHYLPMWHYIEIVEVQLADGTTGVGESFLYKTNGPLSTETATRLTQTNPFEHLWADDIHEGLRMALFDAAARTQSVPVSALIGDRCTGHVPIAWWCCPMPPSEWKTQIARGLTAGYRSFKCKARPWYDVWGCVDSISSEIANRSANAHVGLDFNETLLDTDRARTVLNDLQEYAPVSVFESPILRDDVDGNRRLSRDLQVDTALHYRLPEARRKIRERMCDGFVVGGDLSALSAAGTVVEQFGLPGFLQYPGTDVSTAFALQCASTLDLQQWPIVTCSNVFEPSLVRDPFDPEDGSIQVSDEPGLGIQLDRDAIDRYRTDDLEAYNRPSKTVLEVQWPDRDPEYYVSHKFNMLQLRWEDRMPGYERGVRTEIITEDQERHEAVYPEAKKPE